MNEPLHPLHINTTWTFLTSPYQNGLYKALKGRVKELHVIGQALAPRKMLESTLDGLRIGRTI